MTLSNAPGLVEEGQRCWLAVLGSNDGVWDWNFKKEEVYFSDRWKSMLGYLPDDIGSSLEEWRSRVHPDDRDMVIQAIQQHLAGETDHYCIEYRMRHKWGYYLWILDRGRGQFDDSGMPVRMAGTYTDVSERRHAEEAVHNMSEELQTILNLSPDGFVAFDRQGKVKYSTLAFEELTRLGAKQVHDLHEDQFWELMASLSKPQSTVGNVETLRNNLDQIKTLRRSLIELEAPAGRVLSVKQRTSGASTIAKILCFRDVSHEIEVDRMKTEFLSTAAHELRSPLASIFGFSELLLEEDDPATCKEFTRIVYQQAQAMIDLLNEMLDLARIEARRQTDFVFASVSAKDLVQEVVDGFMLPAGREAPHLEVATDSLFVRVDVKKASQVILNVLSNAYKYSPSGGPVTIRLENVPLNEDASEVVIHICDQGVGMNPSEVARVFDRFFRASPSASIPGTGLGMSIVKEIMTVLDGRIQIDSQPGAGTCVALYLPSA